MVSFQQVAIRIEKEKEFEELKSAINRAFDPEMVEKFLKQVRKRGARIRDLEAILARGVFEKVDDTLAKLGAQTLYQALTVSDQGTHEGVLPDPGGRSRTPAADEVSTALSLLLNGRTTELRGIIEARLLKEGTRHGKLWRKRNLIAISRTAT